MPNIPERGATKQPVIPIKPIFKAQLPDATSERMALQALMSSQATLLDPSSDPGDIALQVSVFQDTINQPELLDDLRRQRAQEKVDRELSSWQQLYLQDQDPAFVDMARKVKTDKYAMEEMAAEVGILSSIADGELNLPEDQIDPAIELNRRYTILANRLDEEVTKAEERGTVEKIFDIAGYMFNPISQIAVTRARTGAADQDLISSPANRMKKEIDNLLFNVPAEEFETKLDTFLEDVDSRSAIFGTTEEFKIEALQNFLQYVDTSVFSETNVNTVLAGVDLGTGAVGLMKALGSSTKAAKLGTNSPHHNLTGVTQSPLQPNLGIAGTIQAQATQVNQSIKSLLEKTTKYNTPTELQTVKDHTIDTYNKYFNGRIIDAQWQRHGPSGEADFTPAMDIYMGKADGTGFNNQNAANLAARMLRLKSWSTVQDIHTRKWIIKTEKSPVESPNFIDFNVADVSAGWLRGSRQLLDDRAYKSAVTSEATFEQMTSTLKPLVDNLRGTGSKSRNAVDLVLNKGNIDEVWYSEPDFAHQFNILNGRSPTKKERRLYYTIKELNDIDWAVRNHAMRQDLNFEGWKSFRDGALIKPIEDSRAYQGMEVWDLDTSSYIDPANISQNHKVYILKDFSKSLDPAGKPVKFMTTAKSLVLDELPTNVLSYRAGGHRIYDGKWFIKQTKTGTTGTGRRFVDNPFVISNFKSRGEATKFADQLNEAILLRNQWQRGAITQADADLGMQNLDSLNGATADDINRMILNGELSEKTIVEATFSGQQPREMTRLVQKGHFSLAETQPDDVALYNQTGKLFYSPKGAALERFNTGDAVPIVSVFDSTSSGLVNALKTGAYYNYRMENINAWYNMAVANDPDLASLFKGDSVAALKAADIKESPIANKLHTLRRELLFNLHGKTHAQTILDNLRENFQQKLFDSAMFSKAPGLTTKLAALVDIDPVRSLRSLTFDRHLGAFGIDQLLIQSTTAQQLTAMAPVHAVKAWPQSVALSMALAKRGYVADNVLDSFLTTTARLIPDTGITNTAAFRARIAAWDKVGPGHVGGELALLDEIGEGIHTNQIVSGLNTVRHNGRMFFFKAEQLNRMQAFNTAYNEGLAKGVDMTTQNGTRWLTMKVQDYTMNMTRASSATWQRGPLSLFTQFFGYMGRMTDSIMGKQFTKGQKAGLWGFNVAAFGAAGIPTGSLIVDYLQSKGYLTREQSKEVLTGVWDDIISNLIGTDTNFAGRAGPGRGFDEYVRSFFTEEDTPFWTAAGPSADTVKALGDIGSNFVDLTHILADTQYGLRNPTAEAIVDGPLKEDLIKFITPFSRYHKAYIAYKYNALYTSRHQKQLVQGITLPQALAIGLGIEFSEVDAIQRDFLRLRNRQEIVEEAAASLAGHLNFIVQQTRQYATTGDQQYRDNIEQRNLVVQHLLRTYSDDILLKDDIWDLANKWVTETNIEQENLLKLIDTFGSVDGPIEPTPREEN